MFKEYTREQLQKLYKKLSEELREAIFSEETAEHIQSICDENNVKQNSSLAEKIGNVLVGILPPDEFQETLEKELKLEKEKAKKVTKEVNRFIFYPVRPSLEVLYDVKTTFSKEPTRQEKIETEEEQEEDKYREPIE